MNDGSIVRCAWCGERMAQTATRGRPRRYCRRSHRQRHYEARREAERRDLDPGTAVYRQDDVGRVRDAIYVLEAALADARMDVADSGTLDAYPDAFASLGAAIESLARVRWEPTAAGVPRETSL